MNFLYRTFALLLITLTLTLSHAVAQSASPSAAAFPPLEQWKSAVIAGNATALRALYSGDPAAHVMTAAGDSSITAEIAFWTGLKPRRMKLDVIKQESPQAGEQQVVFQAELQAATAPGEAMLYVTEGQLWQQQQQNGSWKLVASKRSEATQLQQPTSTSKVIYAPGLDAHAEIQQALALAAKQHKNVIVVFGANWCYDCHVLDLAFHRPDLAGVLQRNYEVVHVDVGEGDKNQDIMQQYQVPMKKGIPALAVLNSNGKLLYSQQGGEFEKARSLAPQDLLAFLNKWKPGK